MVLDSEVKLYLYVAHLYGRIIGCRSSLGGPVVYATIVDKICSAVAQSMEFKSIVATSATPHPHAKMMQDQGCAKVTNRVYHTQIQPLGIFYVRGEGGHAAARC